MKPTLAEKAVISELRRIAGQAYGTTSQLPFSDLIPSQRRAYWQTARWHLSHLEQAWNEGYMKGLLNVNIHHETALKTLHQIADLPRGGRAKRLAVATLRFLENVE